MGARSSLREWGDPGIGGLWYGSWERVVYVPDSTSEPMVWVR